MRTVVAGVVAGVAIGWAAGCRSEWEVPDPPRWELAPGQVDDPHRTDRIVAATAPLADFLWVIDDSCSMADEQAALVDAFPSFAERIVGSGLDFHIGVVSTDIDMPWADGRLQGGSAGLYIDPRTDDPVGAFADMANLGTAGSPFECGLGAVYHALGENVSLNGDFYRAEAALHTVVISDEDDETPADVIDPDGFVLWYRDLKVGANLSSADLSFSSIIDLDEAGRYLSVTARVGGASADIGYGGSWDDVLAAVADQGLGHSSEFFLSILADPATIEVREERTDGVTLPHAPDVWRYDPVRNSVVFEGYAPQLGATLVFDYTPQAYGL